MKESRAIELINEYIEKFIPGAYFGGFSNSKRTLGTAHRGRRGEFIKISRYLVMYSTEEHIRNTIAHECAHILAYRKFGTFAHDNFFYQMCAITGADQKRCASNDALRNRLPASDTFTMIIAENGKVKEVTNNSYIRRPRKSLSGCYLTSRKYETLDKLYYCRKTDAVVGAEIVSSKYWR